MKAKHGLLFPQIAQSIEIYKKVEKVFSQLHALTIEIMIVKCCHGILLKSFQYQDTGRPTHP